MLSMDFAREINLKCYCLKKRYMLLADKKNHPAGHLFNTSHNQTKLPVD